MYKHLLIPTDGSALAEIGLKHGLALAVAVKAEVSIVTVQANDKFEFSTDEKREEAVAKAYATRTLDRAKILAKEAGISCYATDLPKGEAADAILQAAKKRGCDLIVISSHGRTGLALELLGSVTTKVLNLATIPVLVCREQKDGGDRMRKR